MDCGRLVQRCAAEPRMAIEFESDLQNLAEAALLCRIPAASAATTYEAAVIADSTKPAAARDLFEYLTSKPAQACFHRCGFAFPSETRP